MWASWRTPPTRVRCTAPRWARPSRPVGLSVLVGTQGVIFVDGNADIRSGSSSINGSIGYRYNFLKEENVS